MLTAIAMSDLGTQNAPGDSNTALPKLNKWAANWCPEQMIPPQTKGTQEAQGSSGIITDSTPIKGAGL